MLSGNFATNGGGAIYGTLVGCTLTTNLAGNGGGTCSNNLINCLLLQNTATTNGGGTFYANLVGCNLIGNWATNYGGGSFYSNLTNCYLYANVATFGGGMAGGIGSSCIVSNNQAVSGNGGGGVFSNTLFSSLVSSNFGGGSSRSTLSSCWILGNMLGPGSSGDNLNNCALIWNATAAAIGSTLNNCTAVYNGFGIPTGGSGYGIQKCNLTNSILYYNYLTFGSGNMFMPGCNLDHCCTAPLAPGNGNFTNAPLFLDNALHLASNSPCIDVGDNAPVIGTTDLDGRPRVINGIVDIGAMEFQGASIEPFISWLDQYGLPDDGSADYVDSDGTGMNNWQKWIAGLNPTNNLSVLKMISALVTNNPNGTAVTWQSVTNVTYYLQRSSDLMSFNSVQSNLVGQASTTSFTDISATNAGPYFYRVGVQQ
jgi:hypothetical protein